MSKLEDRKSAASNIVELLQAIIALMPEEADFDLDLILRESADAMNIANRNLFSPQDIGAAISGIVYRACKMDMLEGDGENQKAFEACRAFGDFFCQLMDSQPENFAPHHIQWKFLKSAIHVIMADETMSVRDLAKKAKEAGIEGNIDSIRRLINADIAAGRLPAKKLGNLNTIKAVDAAEWLANPARGSRTDTK